jgi:hypothetical protein
MKSVTQIKKPSKILAKPIKLQQTASTKKVNTKKIYNTQIKNFLKSTKTKNSSDNNLNSTREPKEKNTLIDFLNEKDSIKQESFLKSPSTILKEKKNSDITILEEFNREQLIKCNISSYLNYELGNSLSSNSSLDETLEDNTLKPKYLFTEENPFFNKDISILENNFLNTSRETYQDTDEVIFY